MCTRQVTGQKPSDKGVVLDMTKDVAEYSARYNQAMDTIEQDSIKLGKTPGIDWSWTDWNWKPVLSSEEYDTVAASGMSKPRGHYPGNKHWVCLHFDGTGFYNPKTDTLIINHKQVWIVRAKILSQVMKSYGNLVKGVRTYDRDGPFATSNLMGQGLRTIQSQEAAAMDTIQKFTRDLDEISSFTIDKSMDSELIKDPRANSEVTDEQERWQFFYTHDFMRKVPTGKRDKTGVELLEWSTHDMWGYDFHKDDTGRKVYTDKCFNKLTAIMNNQSHHQAEIFLRRVEPKNQGRIIRSPNEHWERRTNFWNGIFEQFHGQVEGWWDNKEKYHYGIEYFLKTLLETANKVSPEQREDWKITPGEMDFRKNLENAVMWNSGNRIGIESGSQGWHPTVYVVRNFVIRGMNYFIQEQIDIQEQRKRVADMVALMNSTGTDYPLMVRRIISNIKPGLWLMEETLQHFYSERVLYSRHRTSDGSSVRVGEHDLKDWGKFNKQLLFKLLMLEGLCIARGWISDDDKLHRDFHKVARAWQCRGNQRGTYGNWHGEGTGYGFGESWITQQSFRDIWHLVRTL
jgi:hypothetical protein